RCGPSRQFSKSGRLRRPHTEGSEARGSPVRAAYAIRAGDQPEDRQGAWDNDLADAPFTGRSCGRAIAVAPRGLTSRSTGPLAGGAYAPSARRRLAWFVRPRPTMADPNRSQLLMAAATALMGVLVVTLIYLHPEGLH